MELQVLGPGRARGAGPVVVQRGGLSAGVLPGELDSERFASLVEEARAIADEEPQRAVELLREALSLWHADPFRDVDVRTDWVARGVRRALDCPQGTLVS
ncbi:BTAD domain-containing putative transcriptional regulator [Amycolatopsis sp. NPDC052450]|uniref:BTAD domain-containing putative transcriptional regulator n=1 Tax=Amycolatopsis sp. NPDC052450 TaxID=3363937 RepID=UPI0037C5B05E